MAQLQGEAEKNTEVALENMKKIYESRIQAKESELIKTIEDAKLKENEIISTLEEKAKEEKLRALGAKDIETSNKLKEETVKLESRLVKEMKKCLQIKDDEAQKILLMLKAQVGLIKKENNETKILIQEDLQSYQLSLMNEMKFVINKVVKQSNKLIEKRKEEVRVNGVLTARKIQSNINMDRTNCLNNIANRSLNNMNKGYLNIHGSTKKL